MAYTGTGSQDDPFIVSDWNTFVSLASTSGVYIKWEDVAEKLIDFNNINPFGYTSTIVVNANVDFNNWVFRNLVFDNKNSHMFNGSGALQNGVFINLYVTSLSLSQVSMVNMVMTGKINTYSEFLFYGNRIRSCSIILDIIIPQYSYLLLSHYTSLEYNYMRLNILSANKFIVIHEDGNLINSRYNINNPNGDTDVFQRKNASCSSNSCVFDIATKRFRLGTNATSLNSVYNSDTIETTTSVSGLMGCTTEQLKDAEYLESIGFPIGV